MLTNKMTSFPGSYEEHAQMSRCRQWQTSWSTPKLLSAVQKTIDWINEALHLRHAGMPPSAYRLHFEAPMHTVENVWGTIKSLAACFRATAQVYDEAEMISSQFQHKIDRESILVNSVRLILSGDPTVQLSCSTGTLQEFEEEIDRISSELRSMPRDGWEQYGYAANLLDGDLDASGHDFRAIQELYADYPA
jgi:hypothetical protein